MFVVFDDLCDLHNSAWPWSLYLTLIIVPDLDNCIWHRRFCLTLMIVLTFMIVFDVDNYIWPWFDLVFRYPQDVTTYSIDRQFMWSDSLLISPVTDQVSFLKIYSPCLLVLILLNFPNVNIDFANANFMDLNFVNVILSDYWTSNSHSDYLKEMVH